MPFPTIATINKFDILSGDGRYAIRLANEGIAFDEANGWNVLADDVEIR